MTEFQYANGRAGQSGQQAVTTTRRVASRHIAWRCGHDQYMQGGTEMLQAGQQNEGV